MDKGKIIQTGTPKEMLYHPKNDFVKEFFAANRLLLEYKVTVLKDLLPFLSDFKNDFPENSNIWNILQKLSSDQQNTADYEKIMKAFNDYRKSQIV